MKNISFAPPADAGAAKAAKVPIVRIRSEALVISSSPSEQGRRTFRTELSHREAEGNDKTAGALQPRDDQKKAAAKNYDKGF
jgi:hypothetical protein